MPTATAEPPVLLYQSNVTALEAAKRRLNRIIDGEIDELIAPDALDLLDWLRDDAEARRIETEGEGPCAVAR
jgi:hypothetical protein